MARNKALRESMLEAAAILAALLLWQAAALILNQRILLVGPVDVVRELARQAPRPDFWLTAWFSLRRIFSGFFLALFAGMSAAALSRRFKAFRVMLRPYMLAIKSTPVASIIILILIFLNSRNLSLIVSFLIVLPVVYANILEGLSNTDEKLIEMAGVFHANLRKRIHYIYLPQLKPHLISACAASIGMAWKSGTAAEVIGIPNGSIGERLYEAKIYLSSSELFAWTLVIILLSILTEKLVLWLIAKSYEALWRS
jgi:NitT/TauT family transport system permease protein